MFIDSHAHLEMSEFDSDREEVLKRAAAAGVDLIVTVGTNVALSRRAVDLAQKNKNVFATIGVHPHDAERADKNTWDALKKLAQANPGKVVAYGEIGLDFFRNLSARDVQLSAFGAQLELAADLRLPVVIHDREAHEQTLAMIRASGVRRGVFHCFSGDYEMAGKCLDLGFYLSIPGVVTFQKAKTLQDVVARVPLSSLLLETDAPYLAPVPHRGERNEPSFLIYTAEKVAEIKKSAVEDIATITAQNTMNLFGLTPSAP
jgi:TatD DNase family protein